MTPPFARPPIAVVVQQHAEESAMLRHVRSVLVRAPHVRLHQLRRLDDRIAAHLDGLAVAGSYGASCALAGLERCGAGEVFAVAVGAIEGRDVATLDRLRALAAALPDARRGLMSAAGWVSAPQLKGIAGSWLASADPLAVELGLAACRMHQTDPGAALPMALRSAVPALRAAALRAAAELARTDVLPAALAALDDEDAGVCRLAARAACLLGDRGRALQALAAEAHTADAGADSALALLLPAAAFAQAREHARSISAFASATPGLQRRVLRVCGLLGDTTFVPWLIDLMADDGLARLAGESFTLISGADLAALDLERKPPETVDAGPSEDADDDDVALDDDESLPWPDRERVSKWWAANTARFPAGQRLFMGAPPSPEQAWRVLREGAQRQRLAAARLACLLEPATMLFPTAAPAWRQQRRLAPT